MIRVEQACGKATKGQEALQQAETQRLSTSVLIFLHRIYQTTNNEKADRKTQQQINIAHTFPIHKFPVKQKV